MLSSLLSACGMRLARDTRRQVLGGLGLGRTTKDAHPLTREPVDLLDRLGEGR